jgi:hypothetical protein
MTMRRSDPSLQSQAEAVTNAREELAQALRELSLEAASAWKITNRSSTRAVDLTDLHRTWRVVLAGEERLDMAVHDLDTASGEDA